MRVKVLEVTFEALGAFLRPDGGSVTSDFPKSAKVIDCRPHPDRYGIVRLAIEDESFPDLAEGSLLQKMTVTFRYELQREDSFASLPMSSAGQYAEPQGHAAGG